MGISGNDLALMYAQFGVMRFGASRFGYHSPKVFVSVGGVHRANGKVTATDELEDLNISETNSETPNRASFQAIRWTPEVGMEVLITLGSKNRLRRLFGGTILDVKQRANGLLPIYDAECVDWSWLLDGEPVYGHYTGSPSTIAAQLMADHAPAGFTVRQIEAGLPTLVGGITFTGVKLSAALRRLAKRAGARTFIDYQKDLYFRVTPSAAWTNPRPIVGNLDTLKTFTFERDLGQIANRVPFIGGGSNTLTEVAIGETILPLTDAPDWWYGDVGGVVISGPQRISYTARVEGGGGSVVGPGVSPTNAPTASLAAGSGVDSGAHVISFVWKTATGRTLPGATTTIVVGLVSAPSAAVIAGTPSGGGLMDAGTHRYYSVFRTAAGSTTAGPVSNAVTTSPQESAPTTIGAATLGVGGSLDASAVYSWKYTFYRSSDGVETTPSPASNNITTNPSSTSGFVSLTGVQAPPSGFTRRWYRTEGGGSVYKLIASPFEDFVNNRLRDESSDASLGAPAPTANTTGKGTVLVSGIPISPEPLVTHVDMFREFNNAGAATAKLAFSVTNGTTSATDTVANSGLGATVPATNTATANQIALSGIAVGPSGTTERDVYMSPVGGGTRRLALNIPNNTATTGTITMSDATLAGQSAEPISDTSGLTQPTGQINPGASSVVVSGTAPFLDTGGWAFTGTQVVRYTGFTGGSLTGVPASGPGSITQPISYGVTIAAAPCLIGIPASGDGSIRYTIQKGETVNLVVTVEDTDAQAGLQALLSAPAPVVRECPPLSDQRVGRAEALNRANAFLTLRAYPGVRVGPYRSKDVNNRVGLEVDINVTTPLVLNDTFQIQAVTISNFTPNIMPDYAVTASDELFSLEAILAKET
jgi:hypothetical protein